MRFEHQQFMRILIRAAPRKTTLKVVHPAEFVVAFLGSRGRSRNCLSSCSVRVRNPEIILTPNHLTTAQGQLAYDVTEREIADRVDVLGLGNRKSMTVKFG